MGGLNEVMHERHRAEVLVAFINLSHPPQGHTARCSRPWTRPGTSPLGAICPIPESSTKTATFLKWRRTEGKQWIPLISPLWKAWPIQTYCSVQTWRKFCLLWCCMWLCMQKTLAMKGLKGCAEVYPSLGQHLKCSSDGQGQLKDTGEKVFPRSYFWPCTQKPRKRSSSVFTSFLLYMWGRLCKLNYSTAILSHVKVKPHPVRKKRSYPNELSARGYLCEGTGLAPGHHTKSSTHPALLSQASTAQPGPSSQQQAGYNHTTYHPSWKGQKLNLELGF